MTRQQKRSIFRILGQLVLVLFFIALGVLGAYQLIGSREAPPAVEREETRPLVEVQRVERADIPIVVRGLGTVQPKVILKSLSRTKDSCSAQEKKTKTAGPSLCRQPSARQIRMRSPKILW